MGLSSSFDQVLLRGDEREIFNWAMDRLAWSGNSPEALGIASFAFYLSGQHWQAREMALEVLREDPDEEWALATFFAGTSLRELEKRPEFFEGGTFRLDPDWIGRFHLLDCAEESKKVLYCLARYGSPEQRRQISEDWLVRPPEKTRAPVGTLGKKKKHGTTRKRKGLRKDGRTS